MSHLGGLYAESGGDTTRCELCKKKLTFRRPWERGLDGAGAHTECLDAVLGRQPHAAEPRRVDAGPWGAA